MLKNLIKNKVFTQTILTIPPFIFGVMYLFRFSVKSSMGAPAWIVGFFVAYIAAVLIKELVKNMIRSVFNVPTVLNLRWPPAGNMFRPVSGKRENAVEIAIVSLAPMVIITVLYSYLMVFTILAGQDLIMSVLFVILTAIPRIVAQDLIYALLVFEHPGEWFEDQGNNLIIHSGSSDPTE